MKKVRRFSFALCWVLLILFVQAGGCSPLTSKVKERYWIERLKGGKTNHRLRACIALGQMKSIASVPHLIEATHDSEWMVRESAIFALKKIDDPRVVPALIEALDDPKEQVCLDAMTVLGSMGDSRAIDDLYRIASEQKYSFLAKRAAIGALCKIEDERTVELVLEAFSHTDLPMEPQFDNFFKRNKPIIIPRLVAYLKNGDFQKRLWAIKLLSRFGTYLEVPALKEFITAEEPQLRKSAVFALGLIGHASVQEALTQAIEDPDWEVRSCAIRMLARLKQTKAVPLFTKILREDSHPEVRRAAVRALGYIGERRDVPPLIEALREDPYIEVRNACAWALGEIRDPQALYPLITILDESKPMKEWKHLSRPSRIETGGLPPRVYLLEQFQQTTIRSLRSLGDRRATLPMLQMLDSPSMDLQGEALATLGVVGEPSVLGELRKFAEDGNKRQFLRRSAYKAIEQICQRASLPMVSQE